MAKEMIGMREREVAAPPSRRTSILWGDSWVQARFCWKTLGKSLAFTKPQCSMLKLEVDATTQMSWEATANPPGGWEEEEDLSRAM